MDALTLVLAEDEPLIRLAMELTLQECGFQVVAAPSGDAALSVLRQEPDRYAGLITDIRLGEGTNGWALARQARTLAPDICVIYVTGDSAGDWSAQGVPGSIVMQKPVPDAQLLTGISTLLNERKPPTD